MRLDSLNTRKLVLLGGLYFEKRMDSKTLNGQAE